jgi:hypothetical protein
VKFYFRWIQRCTVQFVEERRETNSYCLLLLIRKTLFCWSNSITCFQGAETIYTPSTRSNKKKDSLITIIIIVIILIYFYYHYIIINNYFVIITIIIYYISVLLYKVPKNWKIHFLSWYFFIIPILSLN